MIAVRLLSREEVASCLEEFGGKHVENFDDGPDPYYRASYWRTSWGHYFFVPEIGPDRMCPEQRMYEILADLSALAPKNRQ